MKLYFTAILCAFVISGAFAQTSDEEAEAIVTLLGVQKRDVIAHLVPVSGKDSVAFWKLYNEYQQSNKTNNRNRIQLYEKTGLSYERLTPAIADSLASKFFVNRLDQEKQMQLYYNKIKTATNAIVAFEFYQAETYLLTQLRGTIMQQIPTYGQVQGTMKKK